MDPRLAFDPADVPSWLKNIIPPASGNDVLTQIDDDDCAVLALGDGLTVVTTDFLNAHPIAIELGIGGSHDLGRLVVASNLADLAGSGATPRALLLGACLPRASTWGTMEQLMSGALYEAGRWNVPLVGGDTKLGDSLSIFGVAIGWAAGPESLFLRTRAEPGDTVWVSGPIGGCAAAIVGLAGGQMDSDWREWARRAVVEPTLPLEKSRLVSAATLGLGGTDISDGLGADIAALCRSSGVGVRIDASSLPLDAHVVELSRVLKLPAYAFAFGVGGDFQFIVTAKPESDPLMHGFGLIRIGQILPDPSQLLLLYGGRTAALPIQGHTDGRRSSFVDEMTALLGTL